MRIVVVDPSRTVLLAISRLLDSAGHVASVFVDGQSALDFIKATADVDALITSAELTAMSGLELCWEVRLLSGHGRAIYIILMSSNSEQKHLINALDSGADEFIGKPPADEELYARLRSAERLLRLQRELIRLAMVDPLTGVFNRRAFFEKAQAICTTATAAGRPTAIMFDVDHFKRVNDTYGHDIGDEVLRAIGRETADDRALVGRLGGEEFAILLARSDLAAATNYAEGIRAKLSALSFETARGTMSVTCSFGVVESQEGETVDQLLKRADIGLYQAKNGGRDRVIAATPADADGGQAQWSGLLRADFRGAGEEYDKPQPLPFQSSLLDLWSSHLEETMPSSPDNNNGQSSVGCAFVLDDEPQIGALVCKVLEACGLTARQFTSPAPFLIELEESPPGLVVLDLSLGQSDAVEIIHHLEVVKYRGKVLLISGRDEVTLSEITQIGEKHGLVMLPPLKKPFRANDVKLRLASHVADAASSKLRDRRPDSDPAKKVRVQLVEALCNNWLEVWYQPKIDLKSFSVCGAEGLVRARHPVHGIVTPENLLPPPGDSSYQPLTKFVIERAMADWSRFAQQGVLVKLSLNAPVSVIHTPAFMTMIRSLPRDPKFPGLVIEVTEDEIIRDSAWAREIATQLKLYNVQLSIDDFGSGYASLSRLNDLPFVEVKIDRSFVVDCAANTLKHGLCQTVIDLAHRFGATACAEGVETIDDLRALIAMHCDSAQGFLFATPMPAAEFAPTLLAGFPAAMRSLKQEASSGDHRRLVQSA